VNALNLLPFTRPGYAIRRVSGWLRLAPVGGFRFNDGMRAGATVILLGLTALVAYSLGRQDAPTGKQAIIPSTSPLVEKPVALLAAPTAAAQPMPSSSPSPAPSAPPSAMPSNRDKAPQPDTKRKAPEVLTTAAIAAIIVQASRDRYYASGHPCACPEDFTRNGQRCGGRSAYSRPGGAAPLCYPTDVTPAMIEAYRRTATTSR
jgi:hypothetical protein